MLFVAFFVLIVPSLAWSQATTSIRGTVLDPNGALVSDAKVTLENVVKRYPGTEAAQLATERLKRLPSGK